MVGAPTPHSPSARDGAPSYHHPGWPRSPFRGGKDEEGGPSDDVSAADSWSVRSEYGSTLDGEDPRGFDVLEVVPDVENGHQTAASNPQEETDASSEENEQEGSELGLQSHWDTVYAQELATFHEHGQPGEIWFGADVMETVADWTARLAAAIAEGTFREPGSLDSSTPPEAGAAAEWQVLDVGCGNGLLLHALAHRGFRNLTGTDYSEAGVNLARSLASREPSLEGVTLLLDDILASKLPGPFDLVVDKGTLDAVGLHPTEGPAHRHQYQAAVARLVRPGGLLVITSCNSTRDELVFEFTSSRGEPQASAANEANGNSNGKQNGRASGSVEAGFEYVDHVRSYPVFHFGGSAGTRVCTVAFRRKQSH